MMQDVFEHGVLRLLAFTVQKATKFDFSFRKLWGRSKVCTIRHSKVKSG